MGGSYPYLIGLILILYAAKGHRLVNVWDNHIYTLYCEKISAERLGHLFLSHKVPEGDWTLNV